MVQGTGINRGTILRIQRMSTEDGPGIRSTVFFKGCPLRCVWCHNPESISMKPQVHWVQTRCIGCLGCIQACPEKALFPDKGGIAVNRDKCTGCLACTEACPSTAMEAYGAIYDLDGLVKEVLKDRVYFEKSGGGVTLSGGEPTMQPDFARMLLRELKKEGIHTALDTCGQCSWETLDSLLPYTDLILYDIKLMYRSLHKEYTGTGNDRILENLLNLAGLTQKTGSPKELWIRTPVIPGYTSDAENIRAIGWFLRERLGTAVNRWELCAFNNLCTHKYEGLGMDWACRNFKLLTQEEMECIGTLAREVVKDARVVQTSGATRKDDTIGDKGPKLSVIRGGVC
jgi:pyruvate formate lyase activating enzyme